MLLQIIQDAYPSAEDAFHHRVFSLTVLYSVKAIGAFDFQRKLASYRTVHGAGGPSSKDFRLTLISHSYVCLNLKFFVLALIANRLLNDKAALRSAVKEYKIPKADFLMLLRVLRSPRRRKALRDVAGQFPAQSILTLAQVRAGFVGIHPQVFRYIESLSYHKLTFVVTSDNQTYKDIQYELLLKALRAYYLLIPTLESEAYIVNYVKRAVHNHAMNIIKSFHYKKRERLASTRDRDGNYRFTLVCVSENQDSSGPDQPTSLEMIEANDCGIREMESKRAEREVSDYYKADISRTVVRVMFARDDVDFSVFLRRRGLIKRGETNADYYERATIDDYKRQVSLYTGIAVAKIDLFLRKVYERHFGNVA